MTDAGRPVPSDYDLDPSRWATSRDCRRYQLAGDVHPEVARRFAIEGLSPVLDVGCGEGELHRHLADGEAWVGLDPSATQLARAPRPAVLGEATALPFPNHAFGAVAALWVLYHLEDPSAAIREAHRVLRPGGLFAACTSSRDDSPELAHVWRPEPTSFDAEEAPDLVGRVFGGELEVVRWDAPLTHLPTREAVRDYLVARFVPRTAAEEAAATVETPLDLTKRGALVVARKLS